MRKSTLGVLLSLLLLAWPALAQEQRGAIQGVVKDNTGAVLPGATVEARNANGGVSSTVSDENGKFRFPSLLVGSYDVTASLQGFTAAKVDNVQVGLGQIKSIDFALNVGGVAEKVQVTAEPPLISVKQSAKSTDLRAEQIELLPHNRDFTSVLTQAPGVNYEYKFAGNAASSTGKGYTGIGIDGASGAENRYVIDGIETTDIVHGQNSKNLPADFVEEIQIKSSGYEAEYGGSTGGVINVVTKSGSNLYHGTGSFFFQGSGLQGDNNNTLRLKLTDASQAEYITYPKDTFKQVEPGFTLGGPILKDRAWFFAAYQPQLINTERVVNAASSGNTSLASTFDQTQKENTEYLSGSQTAQWSSKLRTRVAFNNSWYKRDGLLPSQDGTDSPSTNYTKGTKYPNWTVSGQADYVATPKFVVSARAGFFRTDQHDYNVPTDPRFIFSNTTNIGMAGVPASEQHPTGYSNILSNSATDHDTVTRKYIQADATWYAHAAGEHALKFGLQVDRRSEDIVSGEQAARVTIRWGTQYNNNGTLVGGPFGYYSVRSNAVLPRLGLITQGNVASNLLGLFVQDSWSVTSKLTINVGVRTENENVPAFTSSNNELGANPIDFSMGDKIAPRAGFAYDLKGDGKTKLYGSWGMFYDIFKLELPQGSFGGQKWIEYYYTLDNPNFEQLVSNSNCPPACSGTLITSIDFRVPSLAQGDVQSTIKPMRSEEATVGVEHQLSNVMAIGARFVHKQIDRGIEDVGAIDANNGEPYIIANPGEGLTQTFNLAQYGAYYAGSSGQYTLPKPKRNYNALELTLEKRLSQNWFFKGTYTLSKLSGNYPGLAESDENGRSDPNVGRMYDYPIEMFNGKGQPIDDVLATDRTHQVKLGAVYQFKWGTSIGANEYVASGLPIGRVISVIGGHGYPMYYNGRDSDGRTPMYAQTDLFVQHEFNVGGNRKLALQFNVLNLFDQRSVIDRFNTYARLGALTLNEAQLYAGQLDVQSLINQQVATGAITPDPRFLHDSNFQLPLLARFGARFTF